MISRIEKIANEVVLGKRWFETTPVEYDRCDLFLDPVEMSAKRAYEYIVGQIPQIDETAALAGYIRFDGSIEGDIFNRPGHRAWGEMVNKFYLKQVDNLAAMEWQHSEGNFKKVIDIGIEGLKKEIAISKDKHSESKKQIFLCGLDRICDAIIAWANKCADYALMKAQETEKNEYKENLIRLSAVLRKIPEKPAETFYEAVQTIYICYPFLPDSIGLIDRQLIDFYRQDIENGTLTRDEAKAYLQELFLMLQARTHISSPNFYRGGESHFCVGGYLPNGEDGFSELTYLIFESLMELPTTTPQISLRWTPKTPHEAFRYVMDCERKDPLKRIAFVNDVPRLKALTEIAEFPFETAVNYTMTGCNEPVMTGGRILGASQQNILRCMSNTFKFRAEDIKKAKTFDEFYAIYEEELFSDMEKILEIDDNLNRALARDCNLVSSIFIDGCIESASSATQQGSALGTSTMDIIGVTSSIDSLAIVRQFVFDEKRTTMETLTDAVNANWQGYEELHSEIGKCGKFFGNDDAETNETAQRFTDSIYRFLSDKRSFFGKKYIVGNLIGYNEHHKWFGALTGATPDGRYDGDPMSFGIGQSGGKDREGLTALLASVAKYDPHCIMTGPSVTNVMIDERLMTDDKFFEQTVYLFETYFKMGGTHFQLNYTTKEELLCAKSDPDSHRSLRVRVSGFSDFFVNLNENLQDEIITRTVKEG